MMAAIRKRKKPDVLQVDVKEATRALTVLVEPGSVFEIRALECHDGPRKPFIISGYFKRIENAVADLETIDGLIPEGVYVTLNRCKEAVYARAPNKFKWYPKHTTSDNEIEGIRWLPVDCDPIRPVGVSAGKEEKEAARSLAEKIADALARELGWPRPFIVDTEASH